MEPNVQNTSPINSNPAPVQTPVSAPVGGEHRKVGPIVAIAVIVIVLIIAAIYLFASKMNKDQQPADTTTTAQTSQNDNAAAASVTPVTNNSDDVNDIQADLNASTNGLDNQNF